MTQTQILQLSIIHVVLIQSIPKGKPYQVLALLVWWCSKVTLAIFTTVLLQLGPNTTKEIKQPKSIKVLEQMTQTIILSRSVPCMSVYWFASTCYLFYCTKDFSDELFSSYCYWVDLLNISQIKLAFTTQDWELNSYQVSKT